MISAFQDIGIACIIVSLIGNGLSALGSKIPGIATPARQITLGIFGAVLVIGARVLPVPEEPPVTAQPSQSFSTASGSNSIEQQNPIAGDNHQRSGDIPDNLNKDLNPQVPK
jgi:hypothetical protein